MKKKIGVLIFTHNFEFFHLILKLSGMMFYQLFFAYRNIHTSCLQESVRFKASPKPLFAWNEFCQKK